MLVPQDSEDLKSAEHIDPPSTIATSIGDLEKSSDITSSTPTSFQAASDNEDTAASLRARSRVDFSVLPLLFLGLFVFQLDRMNLASALTAGLKNDIKITQADVNLGNQMMFLGIVVLEIPSNMLLQRIGPRIYISIQVIIFGLIATLQIFVRDRNGFLIVRSFLGLAEAGYIPGAIYTLSTWYRHRELATRVAIFFFGMFGGNALSPLLASGILKLGGRYGRPGWQWIFLLEGIFTISVGLLIGFLLPGSPERPRPLFFEGLVRISESDGELLQQRIAADLPNKSYEPQHIRITPAKVWKTISHWRRWPHLVSTSLVFSTWSSLTTYTPSIIMALGFDRTGANALACIGPVISLAVVFLFARLSDYTNRRGLMVMIAISCYITTLIIAQVTQPYVGKWSRWGLWTAVNAFAIGYHPIQNTWLQLNCHDPAERSISIALWVMSAISGLMYGTQYFQEKDLPLYSRGLEIMIGVSAAGLVLAGVQIWIYKTYNRKTKELKESGTGHLLYYIWLAGPFHAATSLNNYKPQHIDLGETQSPTILDNWAVWAPPGDNCMMSVLNTAKGVVMVTIAFVFLIIAICYQIVAYVLGLIWPWSTVNQNTRDRKRREYEYRRLVRKASGNTTSIVLSQGQNQDATGGKNENTFFYRVPFEIRRQILMLAFGDQTVHMDLQYRYPFNLADDQSSYMRLHARIQSSLGSRGPELIEGERRGWRWFSCKCHRFPPDTARLSLGRRRNYPWSHFRDPHIDNCLQGMGRCDEWPGEWPVKCQIGIMGWLLSCKQAYLEGIDVLYKTNTIHIASPILMRSIHDIIPWQRLEDMVSLELVWKAKILPLELGLTDNKYSPRKLLGRPVFPGLRILRICFQTLVFDEEDFALGISWPYIDSGLVSQRLHNSFFPAMDRLLERAVPPTTDVTVTCSKWDWYVETDYYLMERQGREETRMQSADIAGLKCWRNTPERKVSGVADAIVEDARGVERQRKGFWVHICIDDVHLRNDQNEYDQKRHDLYNLGPEEYRYNL
ncbi:hypothetical protein V494_01226 [Pseudogymnoascus sp. VKM F-4513 (FW-928)]|nr:hypothetical protein V494_01226 [Pseudogymnoascus sp. VKM F-4513 (FW-928)]